MFNDRDPMHMPHDFVAVVRARIYWDYVERMLNRYPHVPAPSRIVQSNSEEFSRWVDFADGYEVPKGQIFPLGYIDHSYTFEEFYRNLP